MQSAGVFDSLEIDGFTVKVCDEINVKLSTHRVRSLRENDINLTIGSYRKTRDIIFDKIKQRFRDYI